MLLFLQHHQNNPYQKEIAEKILTEIKKLEQERAELDKEIEKFSSKWFVPFDDVKYEAYNFKDGELANENKLKALADYATYKEHTPDALPKFKFNGALIKEFKEVLMPEISPLLE